MSAQGQAAQAAQLLAMQQAQQLAQAQIQQQVQQQHQHPGLQLPLGFPGRKRYIFIYIFYNF